MKKEILIPQINAKEVVDYIVNKLMLKLKEPGINGFVLGISGGIDSTTVGFLANLAINKWNQMEDIAKKELFLVHLPAEASRKADKDDAERVAHLLTMQSQEMGQMLPSWDIIGIQKICCAFEKVTPFEMNTFCRGNLSAEVRAVVLSRIAANKQLIMLNTGNADEDTGIGYCTKRGDNLGDLSPIGDLSKRLVRQIALQMGVPADLVNREPTAGLWADQTDESELGYRSQHSEMPEFKGYGTYDFVEIVVHGLARGFSVEEIEEMTGFKKGVIEDIKFRHENNAPHKSQVAPPSIKVTPLFSYKVWVKPEKE
jgi:NAD+ synthase